MSRTAWARLRLLVGAAILAGLLWRLGTGPVLDGLHRIDRWALLAAAGIAVLTTLCAAWRWSLIARNLGIGLPLPAAIAACYRSQFLNTALPGGVLGDLHRAVRHGRDAGDLSKGLRAVAWDRVAGQVVQSTLALGVLFTLSSPLHSSMPLVAAAIAVTGVAAGLAIRAVLRRGPSRSARALRLAAADIRHGLLARRTWPAILLVSVLVVIGHAATFLVAARTAGTSASPTRLLPLALLVLLAMTVPTNIGGWGPREGASAWLFGAAGLGADQGLATAAVYGVLVLVACLPGAAVLIAEWLWRGRPHRRPGTVHCGDPSSAGLAAREPVLVAAQPAGGAGG